jgi:8-amino-7-oxononanoate synthase
MHQTLSKKLERQVERGLYRTFELRQGQIDFASNDYLGFARSPVLAQKISEAFSTVAQVGSTGSRHLTGHSSLFEIVEEEIVRFHKGESGLLFNSGYTANLGLISALGRKGATILYDQWVHASIRDGIRLSFARAFAWKHNDLNHLESLLRKYPQAMVVAESIYSVDGSESPHELFSVCERYNASLIIDEAHSFGIFPPKKAFANVYTFGKALGVGGAVVIGPKKLREYLINFSRPLMYTTAMPTYSLIAIREAYRHLKNSNIEVEKLKKLIAHTGFKTHIQGIMTPKAKEKWQALIDRGIDVCYLRRPTVHVDTLRVSLHSYNTFEEYEELCKQLL